MIGLLDEIKTKMTAAFRDGKSLEDARKTIDLSAQRDRFCGDSAHKRFVFYNYVFMPATAAAYDQLKGTK